eukprot:gene36476-49129_t
MPLVVPECADAISSSVEVPENEKVFKKIKWLHLAAFLFMGIQTIAYGAVGASVNVMATVAFPVYCNKSTSTTCYGTFDTTPNQRNLGSSNPIWLITFFVALASFDHLVCFLLCHLKPELSKKWLFTGMGANPLRWMEYTISASIMGVAISILCGVTDVHLWFLIFMSQAVGLALGFIIEVLPADPEVSQNGA